MQRNPSGIDEESANNTNSKQVKDVSTQTDYSNSKNISVQTEPRNTLRSAQSSNAKRSSIETNLTAKASQNTENKICNVDNKWKSFARRSTSSDVSIKTFTSSYCYV